jgi:hypothetical protein
MIILVLTLAGLALALALSPSLRGRAEEILYGRRAHGEASEAASSAPEAIVEAAEEAEGAVANVVERGREAVRQTLAEAGGGAAVPTVTAPPSSPAEATTSSEPAEPPEQPAPPGAAAAQPSDTQPEQARAPAPPPAQARFVMPPTFSALRFGMSPAQVERMFEQHWLREEGGELMLVHYPMPDKSQAYRFHFAGQALYQIEVDVKPAEGQSIEQVYEHWRDYLSRTYGNLPVSTATRWSDGTVTVRMARERGRVRLSLKVPR